MTERRAALPCLAQRALPRAYRQDIVGDMLEEYVADAIPRLGPARARAWLWIQLVRNVGLGLWHRLARWAPRRRGSGGVPSSGGVEYRGLTPPRSADPLQPLQDLRYAVRGLVAAPGFTVMVVLTLAVVIGASSTLLAVINGLMLQPLPYPEPESLVMLWERLPGRDTDFSTSIQSFRDWRRLTTSFNGLASFGPAAPIIREDGRALRIDGAAVSADYFAVLGVEPRLGRWLGSTDAVQGADRVVVLSYAYWQRGFGGDPEVVGRSLDLGGTPHRIVGVMGADFWYFDPYSPTPPQLWLPQEQLDWGGVDRGDRMLRVVGRLGAGVSLEQARSELLAVAVSLAEVYPAILGGWEIDAVPFHEEVVDDVRFGLLALFGPVVALFLIGCANVANLLLARGESRRDELAVRAMLGAGWGRLLRLQLAETLLLGLFGGLLGLAATSWASALVVSFAPVDLPLADRVGVDGTVAGLTVVASLIVGALLAVVPALQYGRRAVATISAGGDRTSTSARAGLRARSSIVAAEVALSAAILCVATLLLHSYVRLNGVDPGFTAEDAMTFRVQLTADSPHRGGENAARFFTDIAGALRRRPDIVAAGGTTHLPFSGWNMTDDVHRTDLGGAPREQSVRVEMRRVTPGYLEAMGVPLLRGRGFQREDDAGAQPVALINDALAALVFGQEDPLGRWLGFGKGGAPERQIVGIVGGIKHYGLRESDRAVAYVPLAQYPTSSLFFVVRARGEPLRLTGAVRQTVADLEPLQPVSDFASLESLVARSLAFERFYTGMLGAFAIVALGLASVGILGVVSYTVHRRVREIGIRVALGALPGTVVRLIVWQTMRPVLAGLGIGIVGALGLSRLFASLLYGIGPSDPPTLLGVVACLGLVATASSWLPARRAARVDPLDALRSG